MGVVNNLKTFLFGKKPNQSSRTNTNTGNLEAQLNSMPTPLPPNNQVRINVKPEPINVVVKGGAGRRRTTRNRRRNRRLTRNRRV